MLWRCLVGTVRDSATKVYFNTKEGRRTGRSHGRIMALGAVRGLAGGRDSNGRRAEKIRYGI